MTDELQKKILILDDEPNMRHMLTVLVEKEGYLCGSPGMIDACNNVMTQNNIPLEKIYYDKFA